MGGGFGVEEENFRFVYSVVQRTCKEVVTDFMSKLIAKAPVPASQIIVVADNHSAHHSRMVRDYCAANNLEILFLPPYSSTLSCVERVWSIFKRSFAPNFFCL